MVRFRCLLLSGLEKQLSIDVFTSYILIFLGLHFFSQVKYFSTWLSMKYVSSSVGTYPSWMILFLRFHKSSSITSSNSCGSLFFGLHVLSACLTLFLNVLSGLVSCLSRNVIVSRSMIVRATRDAAQLIVYFSVVSKRVSNFVNMSLSEQS